MKSYKQANGRNAMKSIYVGEIDDSFAAADNVALQTNGEQVLRSGAVRRYAVL